MRTVLHLGIPETTPPARAYEISFPAGDDEQAMALHALASKYGWLVREIQSANSPDAGRPDVLRREQLCEISIDIHGMDHYGQQAHDLLTYEQRRFTGRIIQENNQFLYRSSDYPAGIRIARANVGTHILEERIARNADRLGLPFELQINEPSPIQPQPTIYGPERQIRMLAAIDITHRSLRRHVEARDYLHHTLRGLLGKTFDVMNAATDAAKPRATGDFDPSDYVSMEKIWSTAKDRELSSRLKPIARKIIDGVKVQLVSGQPSPWGEIDIEGNYDPRDDTRTGHNQAFAVSRATLRMLAGSYHNQQSPIVPFLCELANTDF